MERAPSETSDVGSIAEFPHGRQAGSAMGKNEEMPILPQPAGDHNNSFPKTA